MVLRRSARAMPRPVEALPWGSESISSTRWPIAERAVPRLMAVVVLPTPPFWLVTASTRQGLASAGTGEPRDLEDAPGRIALARDRLAGKAPAFARFGDLGRRALALEEE